MLPYFRQVAAIAKQFSQGSQTSLSGFFSCCFHFISGRARSTTLPTTASLVSAQPDRDRGKIFLVFQHRFSRQLVLAAEFRQSGSLSGWHQSDTSLRASFYLAPVRSSRDCLDSGHGRRAAAVRISSRARSSARR